MKRGLVFSAFCALTLAAAGALAQILAFVPLTSTKAVSASTTSASATFTAGDSSGDAIRIYNAAAVAAFVRFRTSSTTATLNDLPIAPGAVEVLQVSETTDVVAVILPSGTGTVYFTKGRGI